VPVGAYLPFSFLAFLTPLISMFYGFTGISMTYKTVKEKKQKPVKEKRKKTVMKPLEA